MVAGVVVGTGTGDDATDDGTVAVVAETTGLVVTVALAIVESLDAAMVLDAAGSEITEEVLAKIVVAGWLVGVVMIVSRSDFSSALSSPEPQATSTPSEATVANATRREETRFMSTG
jgi:hypothetical protein